MLWRRDRGFSTPPARPADPVAERVLRALRDGPIGQEAARLAFEARQATRLHHAAEIERLEAEEAGQLAAVSAEIEAAEADVAVAWASLQQAERRLSVARGEKSRLSLAGSAGLAIRRNRNALRENAEPEIAAFVEEMRDLLASDRRHVEIFATTRKGRTNPATMWRETFVQTNAPSAAARSEAIRAAMTAAEAMRDRADQTGVASELEQLRASIPIVEQITLYDPVGAPPRREKSHAGMAERLGVRFG